MAILGAVFIAIFIATIPLFIKDIKRHIEFYKKNF